MWEYGMVIHCLSDATSQTIAISLQATLPCFGRFLLKPAKGHGIPEIGSWSYT